MRQDLAVLIPTRGRPGNLEKVIGAWDFTNAWDVAHMVVIVDADDPEIQGYNDLFEGTRNPDTGDALFSMVTVGQWMPMVEKLNRVATSIALSRKYLAVGFAGDDHLPQTIGWAERYLTVLRDIGTGMVYGDDGYQGRNLATEWAVTADAVLALDKMVPAPVEHLYCDNAMMDLFGGAGALRHLPEVRIEHVHPIAGKVETDEQYQRVNSRTQFKRDRIVYEAWRRAQLPVDIAIVRALRRDRTDLPSPKAPRKAKSVSRLPIPRHFKPVRGATPDEIGVTLADFASTVPPDQAIVELGVFQGRTALLMAWGARQGNKAHVWGIDAWELAGNTYGPPFNEAGSRKWANYHVQSLGYGRDISFVQGFAVEVAGEWTGPAIGLLFVDDDHSQQGARNAITAWAPHLAPGAVIAVDDYGHPDWPGVAWAVDELVTEGFLEPIQIFHDRLAVTKLAQKPVVDRANETPALDELIVPPRPTEEEFADLPVLDISAITSEGVLPSPVVRETGVVYSGEIGGVDNGTPIDELNLGQLRALAKGRDIVLGKRKDLRADILQAIRDGR